MNQMQGGGSKVMSFGKSRARRVSPDSPKVTFRDVAGVDEAVEELHEIKEFLENPKKFQQLGARIPKGVLLYGPPGTGKTLLARAVAGEAGVPFFSISGSDFVEMFVGVGASRVRDLFEQAKQHSPCIIFVDEIDAVGRHRGAGLGGGHDEREQTLNQLLVEMDGFEMKDNIILIAATNRPDILDPALLRPGPLRPPDRGRPARPRRAQAHPRGAHRAASRSARRSTSTPWPPRRPASPAPTWPTWSTRRPCWPPATASASIATEELEEGIMRVLAGPEKKSRLISEKEKAITAYHEMGHALVGPLPAQHRPGAQDQHRQPRPGARATPSRCPTEDKFLTTMAELKDNLSMTLGGRAAEEVVFGEITTGAANDLEKATEHRQADDHALRHERGARAAHPGPQPVAALPGPRVQPGAGLLGRGGAPDRRRDPAHHRGGARARQGRPAQRTASSSTPSPGSSSPARPWSAASSRPCSTASPRKRSSATRTSASASAPRNRARCAAGASGPRRPRSSRPRR